MRRSPSPIRTSNVLRVLLAFLAAFPVFALVETPAAPLTFGAVSPLGRPALASDGENYFAVWSDHREGGHTAVYGARLDGEGRLLDPVGVRLFDQFIFPAVGYGDGRYLVVNSQLNFLILDREANVIARGRIAEDSAPELRVIFNGRDFVVFWGYDSVRAATVDRDGRVTSPPVTIVPQQYETTMNEVATNGSIIVVLYTRGSDVYAAVTSMTGAPLSAGVLLKERAWPQSASIASSNGTFVAVWTELSNQEVTAMRLDADGKPIAPATVVLTGAHHPRVAASGDAMRLFTLEGDFTQQRLVSRELSPELNPGPAVTLLDRPPLTALSFAVAAGARGTLAVANLVHPNTSVPESGLYAVDGDAPSEAKLVTRAAAMQLDPSIARGDDGTLVVWRELPEPRMRARFNSTVLDLGTVAESRPSVAAVGRTYLVTWSDYERAYARLVRNGAPLGPAMTLDEVGYTPVAASDGRDFVVAWTSFPGPIHVARISVSGEVLDTAEVRYDAITRLPRPALACDRGRCLVAWVNQVGKFICPRLGCLQADERVMAVRFDSALEPIDATPLVLSDEVLGVGVAAAAHDGEYAVAWESYRASGARTIGLSGPLGTVVAFDGQRPAIARQSGAWLLLRDGLVGLRFGPEGALSPEFVLVRDAQSRRAPALVAVNGDVVLAAYERTTRGEAAGGVPRIFLTTIEPPVPKRRAARH